MTSQEAAIGLEKTKQTASENAMKAVENTFHGDMREDISSHMKVIADIEKRIDAGISILPDGRPCSVASIEEKSDGSISPYIHTTEIDMSQKSTWFENELKIHNTDLDLALKVQAGDCGQEEAMGCSTTMTLHPKEDLFPAKLNVDWDKFIINGADLPYNENKDKCGVPKGYLKLKFECPMIDSKYIFSIDRPSVELGELTIINGKKVREHKWLDVNMELECPVGSPCVASVMKWVDSGVSTDIHIKTFDHTDTVLLEHWKIINVLPSRVEFNSMHISQTTIRVIIGLKYDYATLLR